MKLIFAMMAAVMVTTGCVSKGVYKKDLSSVAEKAYNTGRANGYAEAIWDVVASTSTPVEKRKGMVKTVTQVDGISISFNLETAKITACSDKDKKCGELRLFEEKKLINKSVKKTTKRKKK